MPKGIFTIAFVLFFLLLSVSVHAIQIDVPGTIVVMDEHKAVPVSIKNDSPVEQSYSIGLSMPGNASIAPTAGKIGAGKTLTATLNIAPREELEGTNFRGSIRILLGEEQETRQITVMFKEKAEDKGNGEQEPEPWHVPGLLGFFALPDLSELATLENAVNAVLAVVAALLLIAFIARFVKRLEAGK
ncbi:MAG: hypothetical protein JW744_01005 [Candidatus Diapherotrites archaeon]|uniref:Uncharacterized protein n=1 Tax=Candidatus Iainarchaeum sp. TaxID=3101447 RepID=A0A938YT65_9ARCH|nr:hypothetical protein [Candidatus Diapherotrites archaeon]